jgi:hypothetical protein
MPREKSRPRKATIVAGIRPDLLETVEDILGRLDQATTPQALNLPGYRLHRLKGKLLGFWSVTVRATGASSSVLNGKMRLTLN